MITHMFTILLITLLGKIGEEYGGDRCQDGKNTHTHTETSTRKDTIEMVEVMRNKLRGRETQTAEGETGGTRRKDTRQC